MIRSGYFFIVILFAFSCQTESPTFVEKIESAHQKTAYQEQGAIQFDIIANFGGREALNAKVTLGTNTPNGLFEFQNGEKVYINGDQIFCSPETENPARARGRVMTWSYFFQLPYKLSDPGTIWANYPSKELKGNTYDVQKLNFESGTGDAPEDWYIAYANLETGLLDIAAYIATGGGDVKEAEEDPHAIEYLNYQSINHIPIAHNWIFWEWRTEQGLTKKLGDASLANVKFISVSDNTFQAPADYLKS